MHGFVLCPIQVQPSEDNIKTVLVVQLDVICVVHYILPISHKLSVNNAINTVHNTQ